MDTTIQGSGVNDRGSGPLIKRHASTAQHYTIVVHVISAILIFYIYMVPCGTTNYDLLYSLLIPSNRVLYV